MPVIYHKNVMYGGGSGGGGGGSFIDDIIWEDTNGISGTTTIQTTNPLSDYDAVYFSTSSSGDGGYAARYTTVIASIQKEQSATNPVNVVVYPTYGNRYISAKGVIDGSTLNIQTGAYGEGAQWYPIVYEIHGIKFGSGGASAISDLTDVSLNNLQNGQVLKYDSSNQVWVNDDESGGGVGQISALAYRQLTPTQYENLTTAEKNNGTIYFVSENSTGASGLKVITISQADYDNLPTAEKNNGVPYFVY